MIEPQATSVRVTSGPVDVEWMNRRRIGRLGSARLGRQWGGPRRFESSGRASELIPRRPPSDISPLTPSAGCRSRRRVAQQVANSPSAASKEHPYLANLRAVSVSVSVRPARLEMQSRAAEMSPAATERLEPKVSFGVRADGGCVYRSRGSEAAEAERAEKVATLGPGAGGGDNKWLRGMEPAEGASKCLSCRIKSRPGPSMAARTRAGSATCCRQAGRPAGRGLHEASEMMQHHD